MIEKSIQCAGPTKQRGWAGMRVGALFCLDFLVLFYQEKRTKCMIRQRWTQLQILPPRRGDGLI